MDEKCLCNKNTFLNYLLVLILLNLVILYIYQNYDYYSSYFNIGEKINEDHNTIFNNLIDEKNNNYNNLKNNLKLQELNSKNNKLDLSNVKNENELRLKNNNFGVKGPFHEKFKKHLPELGWRNYFIKNYQNIDDVCMLDKECDTNFKGILTENYLKNLKNTDNIYKNVKY